MVLKIHLHQKQANIFHQVSTISSFKNIENKHDVYIGKDCIKKFGKSLREHAIKIINVKKK